MNEEPADVPRGQAAVWAALFAIGVGGAAAWLTFWSLDILNVPATLASIGGLFAAYFTSRAVLRSGSLLSGCGVIRGSSPTNVGSTR